jgi:phage/plasmid primase-like uncharacterized protein
LENTNVIELAADRALLRARLNSQIEALARELFGPPKSRRDRFTLRFPGAIDVVIAGPKRGAWWSHHENRGGGGLEMVQFGHGLDWREAEQWAASWAGIELSNRRGTRTTPKRPTPRLPRREDHDREARIAAAHAISGEVEPIAGTLGEQQYLIGTRGIPAPAEGWPDAIGYHAGERALVCKVTDSRGWVVAVHCIYLDAEGHNAIAEGGRKKKITRGHLRGGVVRLPGRDLTGPLLIAEGLETALSAWAATGYATIVTLSGLSRLPSLPPGRPIIILRDDDKPGSPADRAFRKALDRWDSQQPRPAVEIALPWPDRRADKSDFNDVLRAEGLDAVRRPIEAAWLRLQHLAEAPPPFALPAAGLDAAEAAIARALTRFREREAGNPAVLLRAPPAAGKTHAIGDHLALTIPFDRAAGNPHRVILAVPAHGLGGQIRERWAAGLTLATYRGRDGLCDDPEAVRLGLDAGADIKTQVCGDLKGGPRCLFRESCEYWAQEDEAKTADVLIVAHNFLFEELPAAVRANVGSVIVEEDFTAHGPGTVEIDLAELDDPDRLDAFPVLSKGGRGETRTAELAKLYRKIRAAIEQAPKGGEALAKALAENGLDPTALTRAKRLTWRREITGMFPGMPLADRQAVAEAARGINPLLPRFSILLDALADLAKNVIIPDFEASPEFEFSALPEPPAPAISVELGAVVVHRLRKMAAWLEKLPLLIASASARPELVARFRPDVEIFEAPPIAAPHQTVRQHLGAFGKSGITEAKLGDLVARARLAVASGKRALVIGHKEHDAHFEELAGVSILHHGAVAGDDAFRHVDSLFIIGGPFPRPRDVARQASAETGRLIATARPERTRCTALLADGRGVQFDRMGYADPDAHAVHAGIYDAAILQAIGRGRGLRRTAGNPLEIHVFSNVPLPLPVTSIERYRPFSRLDRMAADGVIYCNSGDMARRRPDLFRSPDAARQARRRWGGADMMRARVRQLLRDCPELVAVTWQPAGQGYRPRMTVCRRDCLDAERADAERHFGELVTWRVQPPLTARGNLEKTVTGPEIQTLVDRLSHSFDREMWPPPPITAPSALGPPPDA